MKVVSRSESLGLGSERVGSVRVRSVLLHIEKKNLKFTYVLKNCDFKTSI